MRIAVFLAGRPDDRRVHKSAGFDLDRSRLELVGDRLEKGLVQPMRHKGFAKTDKGLRSGVGSDAENPQNRRKVARSSSASARFTSDRSYQTEISMALNSASGGQGRARLAAQEITDRQCSIGAQSMRPQRSSSDERRSLPPTSKPKVS
nr:hypothetical protein [Phyllobacterium salinisoli]